MNPYPYPSTRGPWHAHREGSRVGILTDSNVEHVADVCGNTLRQDANARLIAAAPSLLAALEATVTAYPPSSYRRKALPAALESQIRAAINLATEKDIGFNSVQFTNL